MTVKSSPSGQRAELAKQRRKVDFDTYDLTVDELIRRVGKKRIHISPAYQRQFRWDAERQSRLVESVLLGVPVPPLFMATNVRDDAGTQWEVIDGLQRLMTLVNFAGDHSARTAAKVDNIPPLVLKNMDKLESFEGATFESLPDDIRTTFEDRPLKIIVLNDKSELQVRFDLFERLNTGGIILTPHEIRECIFQGAFIDLLARLAQTDSFRTVVVLPEGRWKDGTPQDFALRFFAFLDRYTEFKHSVENFLNDFMVDAHKRPEIRTREAVFVQVFDYLAQCFPKGIKTRRGQTPVNLYEGIAVGAALALGENQNIPVQIDPEWVTSAELRKLTTGATNSNPRVIGRIEYCRDRFLGRDA